MEEELGAGKRRRTIVGFDPGTTSAIAILDLDSNLLLLKSVRNSSFEEMVKLVGSAGKPVVVASDVAPAPEVVRKLSAAFDAYLCVPEMSMEVEEKARLAGRFAPEDNHQRDALAAGLASAGRLGALIEKARKRGGGENWEEAFEKVLKGARPNLGGYREETKPPITRRNRLPVALKLKVVVEREKKLKAAIEAQRAAILALRDENGRLKKTVELERQERGRAITNARRRALPHLNSKIRTLKRILMEKGRAMSFVMRKLRELEGKEVIVLPAGKCVDGALFVPVADRYGADKVVFAETGSGICLEEAGGKKIEEWALVPKDSLSGLTKERLVGMIENYKKNREK